MAVQDDRRENEMRELFQLDKDESEGRSGIDAMLLIDGVKIPFELKSSTEDSVTTVRDFSLDHVVKWQNKHWLFGFYDPGGVTLRYCLYGSPELMEPWINGMKAYIAPDLELAKLLPAHLALSDMYVICGMKQVYTADDVKRIYKKQYKKSEYVAAMDVENGYSADKMLEILRQRAKYLILRGSTLNNPHIPGGYFKEWPKITTNHAEVLRKLVREVLQSKAKAVATE